MLRLWRVKLLDPISIEQYYAPVPQVDRGLSGHLGAGVPLQVHEVPRTFSHLMEKDSALYKLVFIEHNVCISVFNHVFCKFKYFL